MKYHDTWWKCFPSLPRDATGLQYQRIMRLYADHTLNGLNGCTNRSVYKDGGEDHLVLSFFENFVVDLKHMWVSRIAERLGLLAGSVSVAKWSYAYEERVFGETRPRIADLVLHWKDDRGDAAVVIEAKRPKGIKPGILNDKDNPNSRYYLLYSRMLSIPRKEQMLLVDEMDVRKLPAELQQDPRVITWQQIAEIQREVFANITPPELRPAVMACLAAHHDLLGLPSTTPSSVNVSECVEVRPDDNSAIGHWLRCCESYLAARAQSSQQAPPYDWLLKEPSREKLLSSRRQSTQVRELPLWKC